MEGGRKKKRTQKSIGRKHRRIRRGDGEFQREWTGIQLTFKYFYAVPTFHSIRRTKNTVPNDKRNNARELNNYIYNAMLELYRCDEDYFKLVLRFRSRFTLKLSPAVLPGQPLRTAISCTTWSETKREERGRKHGSELENGALTQFTHTRFFSPNPCRRLHLDIYNCRASL